MWRAISAWPSAVVTSVKWSSPQSNPAVARRAELEATIAAIPYDDTREECAHLLSGLDAAMGESEFVVG